MVKRITNIENTIEHAWNVDGYRIIVTSKGNFSLKFGETIAQNC